MSFSGLLVVAIPQLYWKTHGLSAALLGSNLG
jgi:hypothetical protein